MSPKYINTWLFKFANKCMFSLVHQIDDEQIFREHHFVEVKEYLVGQGRRHPYINISISPGRGGVNGSLSQWKAEFVQS